MIISQCKIDGCTNVGTIIRGKRVFLKGYCAAHYAKLRRYNNPIYISSLRAEREVIIDGNYTKIPLGVNARDGYAIVDKEFTSLGKYKWHLDSVGYPSTALEKVPTRMHKIIMGFGFEIDHINRDKLDNRLTNLRFCSKSDNQANVGLKSNNSSGYKGIRRSGEKWFARLVKYKHEYTSKTFSTKEEAALAYNKIALEHFGDFAYLNVVEDK